MPSLRKDGDFAVLTLHPEGKFNPTTYAKVMELLAEVEADQDAKALVITGQGKNFSQGYDLPFFQSTSLDDFPPFVDATMPLIKQLLQFPIPTVSAINGHAFGFGAMIGMASDYRVQREGVGFFCLPEIDINLDLRPSMNALVTSKLSGAVVRDMLFTAGRFTAEMSLARGVVDATADEASLLETAKALTVPMHGKNRKILSKIKHDVNQHIIREIDAALA